MYEVLDGTCIEHIIPVEEPFSLFEACSLRKIDDTYYMIYSQKNGNRLDYATSKSPTGPFEYRGTIVDNGRIIQQGITMAQSVRLKTSGIFSITAQLTTRLCQDVLVSEN